VPALSLPAAAVLAAVSAGAVGYAVLVPLLDGRSRADKRRKALVGGAGRGPARGASPTVNRREQVAQSLKDLEERETTTKITLEMRLVHAGLGWTRKRFYVTSVVLGLVLAFLAFAITESPLVALGAGFSGTLGVPRWGLAVLKKRRIKKFVEELPNAIDVIVRGIRAGLPVSDCMRVIAREAAEPVRGEFRSLVEAQTLGISIGDACAKLYERVPVAEASFFAIVVGIQQKSGGNLSEALGNLSRVLRERRKMVGKIQAMSMEAKASAAIIGALPFIVATLTYFSSPQYIELLWTTQAGKIGLMASGVWMSVGIFVMRRMINFEV
jgi:tight adherence protein B